MPYGEWVHITQIINKGYETIIVRNRAGKKVYD